MDTRMHRALSAGPVEYIHNKTAEEYYSPLNECSGYDSKPPDYDAPVWKLGRMWSTPSWL